MSDGATGFALWLIPAGGLTITCIKTITWSPTLFETLMGGAGMLLLVIVSWRATVGRERP